MKLGDTVETFAKPFAQAMHLDCLDEIGNLKPESNCAGRRNKLNEWGDAAYDFLWPNTKREEQK